MQSITDKKSIPDDLSNKETKSSASRSVGTLGSEKTSLVEEALGESACSFSKDALSTRFSPRRPSSSRPNASPRKLPSEVQKLQPLKKNEQTVDDCYKARKSSLEKTSLPYVETKESLTENFEVKKGVIDKSSAKLINNPRADFRLASTRDRKETSPVQHAARTRNYPVKPLDLSQIVEKALQSSLGGDMAEFELLAKAREVAEVNKILKIQLIKMVAKFQHSLLDPQKSIHKYCIESICKRFQKKSFTLDDFNLAKSKFVESILNRVTKKPKIMLKSILVNLEELRAEVWRYAKLQMIRTEWCTNLYEQLFKLTTVQSVEEFLYLIEKLKKVKDHNLIESVKYTLGSPRQQSESDLNLVTRQIIFGCFGRAAEEIDANIAMLRKWSSKTTLELLGAEILEMITPLAPLAAKAQSISAKRHGLWQSATASINSPGNISLDHIIRSLKPELKILFSKITLNDAVFHPALENTALSKDGRTSSWLETELINKEQLYSESLRKQESDVTFFSAFFSAIYKTLPKSQISSIEIQQHVENFLKLSEANKNGYEYGTSGNLLIYKFKEDIPLLGLLRLMTIDCSLVSTNYMRLLFPGLFLTSFDSKEHNRFDLKYAKGIECAIDIDMTGDYKVTQKKRAQIVLAHDQDAKLAELEMHWSVCPVATGWMSSLSIASWRVLSYAYWQPLVEILTQPKDVSKSLYTPPGWVFKPDLGD